MVSTEMAEHCPSPPQESPSPQCVGREFVRQYYTLLAEAPHFVHRFYSNESIFVHGSDEEIIGQDAIGKKIAALGFHDCRTRIRVLDSHETIGKGVVVQVVGEITVNGDMGAMRRFFQTFVLAPQSEKKYYVYNDIFRYEDELFKETEGRDKDGENDSGPVPDPPTMARPLEQRPPRVISNGGTHGEDLEKYYSMMPTQPQSQSQQTPPTFPPNEQAVQIQLSALPQSHPSGYGAQTILPQRNTSGLQTATMEAPPTHVQGDNTGAWSSSGGPPLTTSSITYAASAGSVADAHQAHSAQSSQQQQTTSFTTLPSQSPVLSSAVAPQGLAPAPTISEQARPPSDGKESPAPTEELEQQRETTTSVRTYASLVKNDKPTKGPQQPPISSSGQPQMVSPGQSVTQVRPPVEFSAAGGPPPPRYMPHQSSYPSDMGTRPPPPSTHWERQQPQPPYAQHPRQTRAPYGGDYASGQSQDARASPAPSGGGGGGRGSRGPEIPPEEGAFLRNVPLGTTDDELRNALTSVGANILDIRLVKKDPNSWYAFVHLHSTEAAQRLIAQRTLKIREATVSIQELRRNDGSYSYGGGGRPPGAGPGAGFLPDMLSRGGRGGRGNVAQRGGDRGRGARGGMGRTWSAGGGGRGGGGGAGYH